MLSFVCFILIVLVASFWAFQGCFSAAIFLGEAVVALMLALSYYEPLAAYFQDSLRPELGEAGFLMLVFFLTLGLMRFLTDKYIPGNVQMPLIVDRIGGGALGLLTGLTMLGTALLAAQMLPTGRSTFGFERFDANGRRQSIAWMLNPDGFVVRLASMLGNGRFAAGEKRFAVAKPDWLSDLALRRFGTQTESRVTVPPDAMELRGVYRADALHALEFETRNNQVLRDTSRTVERESVGSTYLVCRVGLKKTAFEKDQSYMLFTPSQFRLFAPRPAAGERTTAVRAYLAVGMSDIYLHPQDRRGSREARKPNMARQAAVLVKLARDTPLALTDEHHAALVKNNAYEIDVVFELPGDPTEFTPWYIEFKRGARCEIRQQKFESLESAGAESATVSPDTGDEPRPARPSRAAAPPSRRDTRSASADRPDTRPRGRTHVATAVEERTGVADELPAALPSEDAGVARALRGGRFAEGHVVVTLPEAPGEASSAVTRFYVPAEKRMVQIGAELVFAGSVLGQALEFGKRTLNQYFVSTPDGTKYFAQGVYIAADLDGQQVLELQYWPAAEVPERCLEPPTRLTPNVLRTRPGLKCGYIFLVDPGVTLVRFHTSARHAQDLPSPIEVPG